MAEEKGFAILNHPKRNVMTADKMTTVTWTSNPITAKNRDLRDQFDLIGVKFGAWFERAEISWLHVSPSDSTGINFLSHE